MGELKQHQPPMTIDEQVENLKWLGLIINDEEYAKKILNDIDQLKHGKIHELQNATCYPSISRLGEQLEIEINELIYALDNQLPGKVQELRNQKDCSEQW